MFYGKQALRNALRPEIPVAQKYSTRKLVEYIQLLVMRLTLVMTT